MSTIAVSDVDIRTKRIPDQFLVLPLAFAIAESVTVGWRFTMVRLFQSLAILCAFLVFRWIMKGRFGLGDIKLIAASTMAFGAIGVLVVVFFASLFGAVWGILVVKKGESFPFAPFLAFGMIIAMLYDSCVPVV